MRCLSSNRLRYGKNETFGPCTPEAAGRILFMDVSGISREHGEKTMPEIARRRDELEQEFLTQLRALAPRARGVVPSLKPGVRSAEEQKEDEARRKEDEAKRKELDELNRKVGNWKTKNAPLLVERSGGKGGSDGIRCDIEGNLWASAGWVGEGFDGVHVFNPEGRRIGMIKLPETASNLCFGGPKRNRLFITASQSLYSLHVNTRGAHHC